MQSPYSNLRVVDLSQRLSGAFAARLFGDFGADVILVEPESGHPLRHQPPFLFAEPGLDRSTIHSFANWNKRSVTVSGPEELIDILATADVLVTTADDAETLALADNLAADAVHLSITPHGLNDPLTGVPGNNLTACARVGWSVINGYRDEPPLQLPRHQSGYVGGVSGYIAAAAALRRRAHGDQPECVDVSELEALALTIHTWSIGAIYHDRGFSFGAGGGRPRGTPGPLWDLKDGRMNFGIADFHHWKEAMETLGLPEYGEVAELVPDMGRHSRDLTGVAAAMARSLPALERWPVFHRMAELRCVIGVMQNIEDVPGNEQLKARDFLVETEIEGQTVRAAGAPGKLSPSPWRLTRSAPSLGEHDEEVKPGLRRRSAVLEQTLPAASLAEGPLTGIRVLSFGQAWSGTFATELLALLGADVVQIGSLHRPDVFRRLADVVPPGVADPGRTQHALNTQGQYNSVNLHKREVTLDLREARGMELLWRMLPGFDLLVDNFRPTVIPGWGITLEKLHDIRPGMIWASISGYGATGPYWHYPANGATTEPMSGLSSIHGYEGDAGMNTGGLYPDPVAGYFLVASIMAALAHRDLTGEPQRVDLSMMEALNVVCGDADIEFDATGRLPAPMGNRHPLFAPHNHYSAGNGEWLALAVESETAWVSLCGFIDDPRLQQERFATMSARKQHEGELDKLIGAWCRDRDAATLETELGQRGIAAARVRDYYRLYSEPDPHFSASGFVTRIHHPEAGDTWLPGRPWRYSVATAAPIRPAPCVGQHSHQVLVEELGLSESEYRDLVAAGITGTLDEYQEMKRS